MAKMGSVANSASALSDQPTRPITLQKCRHSTARGEGSCGTRHYPGHHPSSTTHSSRKHAMAEEKKKHKHKHKEKEKEKGGTEQAAHFKPCADVKGIRFGGQFIVKSFTVRRASPLELLRLLDIPPSYLSECQSLPFPSTTTYMPTSFTILAHQAWHTLTLGLGTKKSKVVLFVFESESMKAAVDQLWPAMIPLGDVNKKLIRGLTGSEMARFKFRKGCLTIYVYAVRRMGAAGFMRADDLRRILQSVVDLKDFLDHTAMLAIPSQKSITLQSRTAVAH